MQRHLNDTLVVTQHQPKRNFRRTLLSHHFFIIELPLFLIYPFNTTDSSLLFHVVLPSSSLFDEFLKDCTFELSAF